jgi:hypothetical protein
MIEKKEIQKKNFSLLFRCNTFFWTEFIRASVCLYCKLKIWNPNVAVDYCEKEL